MNEVYLTRRERFSSAHRMFRPDWDDEKNAEVFGLCANPNWHGHNYELFVTVKGPLNQETGLVVNLKELSKIIKECIISKLDHKNLNLEVDFLRGKILSSENLVISIWKELEKSINQIGVTLYKIKIVETENNYVEFMG